MTEPTKIWLIEPVANPHDDCWQDRDIWARVVVSAPTAAQARLAAERWALQQPRPRVGNETPSPRAGFTDVKLYHVREAPPSIAATYEHPVIDIPVLRAEKLAAKSTKEARS